MSRIPSEPKGGNTEVEESPHSGETGEEDLWCLPGSPEDEPDFLSPLPRAGPDERAQVAGWEKAQAAEALHLAQAAARTRRLAHIEASGLSWLSGDRIFLVRLGLWQAMRASAAGEDTAALKRSAWAIDRLSGGPGPGEEIAGFLGRHHESRIRPASDCPRVLCLLPLATGRDRSRGECYGGRGD